MSKGKPNIGFKISVVILVFTILTPAILKLAHTFENHEHQVCSNSQTTHFHGLDLDCEFYKFKLQTQTLNDNADFELIDLTEINQLEISHYQFFSTTTLTTCFLRGPPSLI